MTHAAPEIEQGFTRAAVLLHEQGFRPLFFGVKGSVVYELPGTHRDLDVRAIYLAPTERQLSIRKPQHTFERTEGTLDFVGWEVERFLGHLLKHNGNMIELLLTPAHLSEHVAPEAFELRHIGRKFLTRQLYNYYRGYAYGQFKRAQQQIRTGKGATYTYREMYAGIWLLRTGELVFPWAELRAKVEDAGIFRSALIDKFNMDREHLTDDMLRDMRAEYAELQHCLDAARDASPLPATFDGYERCNALLLRLRSKGWR